MPKYIARFHWAEACANEGCGSEIEQEVYRFSSPSDEKAIKRVSKYEHKLLLEGCEMVFPILDEFKRSDGTNLKRQYKRYDRRME